MPSKIRKAAVKMPKKTSVRHQPKNRASSRLNQQIAASTAPQMLRSSIPAKATRETRRKRKLKAGTQALREIRKYQKTFDLLLPKTVFARLVREITGALSLEFRYERQALEALQEATEAFLVTEFELSNLCAIHTKRVTLQQKDMKLIQRIRETYGMTRK